MFSFVYVEALDAVSHAHSQRKAFHIKVLQIQTMTSSWTQYGLKTDQFGIRDQKRGFP
jgi:hypothetical protein